LGAGDALVNAVKVSIRLCGLTASTRVARAQAL
jgi:hypothetical protein